MSDVEDRQPYLTINNNLFNLINNQQNPMLNQKLNPRPADYHPAFVTSVIEMVRDNAEHDGVIRVRVDSSVKSVIVFTGKWQISTVRDISRRVYLETKETEQGEISVIFMQKVFDENAITKNYTSDGISQISKDVMRWLRIGTINA